MNGIRSGKTLDGIIQVYLFLLLGEKVAVASKEIDKYCRIFKEITDMEIEYSSNESTPGLYNVSLK